MIVHVISVTGFILAALAIGILISAVALAYASGGQPPRAPRYTTLFLCVLTGILLWAMAIQAASLQVICETLGLLEDVRVTALAQEGRVGPHGPTASALHAAYICREEMGK